MNGIFTLVSPAFYGATVQAHWVGVELMGAWWCTSRSGFGYGNGTCACGISDGPVSGMEGWQAF